VNIYIFVDGPKPDDAEQVEQDLKKWLEQEHSACLLITHHSSNEDTERESDWALGLEFETTNKRDLKAPLNFLYRMAQNYQLEFVVGLSDPTRGTRTPVCYFGDEEGRPDLHEIAHYIGLKR
jgi:hypothetical protein